MTVPTSSRTSPGPAVGVAAASLVAETSVVRPDLRREYAEACGLLSRVLKLSFGERDDALAVMQQLPSDPQLARLEMELRQIGEVAPDDRQNRILVGLMIESFPAPKSRPGEAYFEALASDLFEGGYPPSVVAVTLRRLRREKEFLPSVAEVLRLCNEEGERLKIAPNRIAALRRERQELINRYGEGR